MKLNFWQWLGGIFFVVALGLIIWRETTKTIAPDKPMTPVTSTDDETPTTNPAATAPATTTTAP